MENMRIPNKSITSAQTGTTCSCGSTLTEQPKFTICHPKGWSMPSKKITHSSFHDSTRTLSRWINQTSCQWLEATLHNIQNRCTLTGSGQSGILSHYLDIQQEIMEKLKDLHTSGLPINVIVARSIMLVVINKHVPELLMTFKYSEVCN